MSKAVIASKYHSDSGSFRLYVSGYVLSIICTLTAYLLVTHHAFFHFWLLVSVVSLALIQFIVQLYFFLHLGKETRPRWKLAVLFFMIMIVLILVIGSLWIMNNLNYRMTPQQMNSYMQSQDGGL